MPEPGDILGAYTLHERINSGGQSEIWLATDAEKRPFAVRLMLNTSLFAFTDRKRFNTGCEVLQACQDGHFIIGYVEHGRIGGQLALVMEYVEGSNLKLLMGAGDPALTGNIAEVLIDFEKLLDTVGEALAVALLLKLAVVEAVALELPLTLGDTLFDGVVLAVCDGETDTLRLVLSVTLPLPEGDVLALGDALTVALGVRDTE